MMFYCSYWTGRMDASTKEFQFQIYFEANNENQNDHVHQIGSEIESSANDAVPTYVG